METQFGIIRKGIFALMFLSLILIGACQEDALPQGELKCPLEAVDGQEDDVVGKWKMVWRREINFSTGIDTTDYSCNNIIYHFKPDGILEVISDVEEAGHSKGEYNYELIWDPYNSGATTFRGIKIGDFERWACSIKTTNMTSDTSPLDGPTLHFVRIE